MRNGKNFGRSESRNIGNKAATGDIILVLDADDLAVTTRAEWTIKKMKRCGVCYGSALVTDPIGNAQGELIANPVSLEECLTKKTNGIVHSSLAYTKEIALKYPYASGEVSDLGVDDWEQQIRMMIGREVFDFIPDVLCAYRVHESAITQTRDEKKVLALKDKILEGLKCAIA
jgi:glycosyltransferase involved in cell wall biosynthesis